MGWCNDSGVNVSRQHVFIVLGMHRGGTSVVARALKALGVPLGNDLLPPGEDNPKGFWEDRQVLAVNEELLRHLHSAYDRLDWAWRPDESDGAIASLHSKARHLVTQRVIESGGIWGFKDPRTSRILPFWQRVIESCGFPSSYLIAVRNPLSVALSFQRRNRIPVEKTCFLWLQHMIPAILETEKKRRIVVDYDMLMTAPGDQIHRLASFLGDSLPPADTWALAEYTEQFLDRNLRHSEFTLPALASDSRVPEEACQAYRLLLQGAQDKASLEEPCTAEHFRHLDASLRKYFPAIRYMNELEDQKTALYHVIGQRDTQIASLTKDLQDLAQSDILEQALSQLNAQISLLGKAAAERERQLVELLERESRQLAAHDAECAALMEVLSQASAQATLLSRTLADRDTEVARLQETLSQRNQRIAVLKGVKAKRETRIRDLNDTLAARDGYLRAMKQAVAERETQITELQAQRIELQSSLSWRVTAPLRQAYRALLSAGESLRGVLSRAGSLPVGPKSAIRPKKDKNAEPAARNEILTGPSSGDYVQDTPPPPGFKPDALLVAFYLPQFHPTPENDAWWGKGFTEWANVARARPLFKGHYQPHLPGELGFYDLRLKEVQARQAALARGYGIGAFCFYFYWFRGQRLLELPIRQYLENQELTLPFCLCWANESWSRRWDGSVGDLLLAQSHSEDDDLAFIEHVAQYMRDPRYLRVHGRPVLLVYRPSLMPDAHATAVRWRNWARREGLGDLYLIYPQSFDVRDPATFGFDAATEFPPNLSVPRVLTSQIQPSNPDFSGAVYDWRTLVERSRQYSNPEYKLFRGVCTAWDNSPRREQGASVFVNSNPDGYREWLTNALIDTKGRLPENERLVFVNAWNEWAEGAHLEPDVRYGYAWLKATRDALIASSTGDRGALGKIVIVSHDAYPHGAQFIALNLARELTSSLRCEVEIVCLGGGPLKPEFAKYGKVHDLSAANAGGPEAIQLASDLVNRGFQCALVNTTVGGHFLATLKQRGLRCVALVHELPGIIRSYNLLTHARSLADCADTVVFPASEVRDAFCEFGSVPVERAVIQPQGVFKPNRYRDLDPALVRDELRARLGLRKEARIALGVGFADTRKGADWFLEAAGLVVAEDPGVHFVWVGDWEPSMRQRAAGFAQERPAKFRNIHFAGLQEDTALYYAGADIFALTSREDPFPCVVLEAMDAGLPVVAFRGSGGSNALIDQAIGENVAMGDCSAFAAAILRILSDPIRRESSGDRGRALISERFSFRKYAFELAKLAGIAVRKVSVVVPNFNYGQYLPARMSSILQQTYPIYEVIFLDDASTDDSLSIAAALLSSASVDSRIVTNPVNSKSVTIQWKRGVEQSDGEIVWIAEADDLSDPEFLATVVRGFEDPEVILSYCESKQIGGDGSVLAENYGDYLADLGRERWSRSYVNAGDDEIRRYLAVKNTIPNVSAVLFRRELLLRILREFGDEIRQQRVTGDWKTYAYLLRSGKLAFFPESLNLHRRHRGGVTIGSFNESQYREIEHMQNWIASNHDLDSEVRESMRRYLGVLREQFGLTCL